MAHNDRWENWVLLHYCKDIRENLRTHTEWMVSVSSSFDWYFLFFYDKVRTAESRQQNSKNYRAEREKNYFIHKFQHYKRMQLNENNNNNNEISVLLAKNEKLKEYGKCAGSFQDYFYFLFVVVCVVSSELFVCGVRAYTLHIISFVVHWEIEMIEDKHLLHCTKIMIHIRRSLDIHQRKENKKN